MYIPEKTKPYFLAVFSIIILLFSAQISFAQNAKRGDIKIVEIMYNSPEAGTDTLEFIEFYNTTSSAINLSGYTLAGVTLTIPANVFIQAKGRLVFSGDSARHRRFYSNYSIKWKSGSLSNSGEVIGIKTPSGVWIDSLKYSASAPWPKEPNSTGPSLVLCNELADNKIATNWSKSTEAVGIVNGKMVKATPGAACFDPNAGKDLISPKLLGVQLLSSTKLLLVFNEALDINANLISNFEGIPNVVSSKFTSRNDSLIIMLSQPLQRGKFYPLTVKNIKDTAGNLMPSISKDVVFNDFQGDLFITEIMYDDPSESDSYEFIELFNATTEEIPLGGLRLAPSVSVVLPDFYLAPGAYFIVAKDSVKFRSLYKTNAWQWNSGELNNTGDSVFLHNTLEQTIDSVIFSNSSPWSSFAAGTGSSLVLCNALTSLKTPSSWEASATIKATDSLGNKYFATPGSACNTSFLPEKLNNKKRTVCGNTILDAGNIGAKYKWSTGETIQTISVDKPGFFPVLIVNGAGAINDTFYLSQLKAAAIFDTIVCANEIVQFTDNTMGATNRTWFFGKNEKSQSADTHYVFKSLGLITVKLVVADSFCTDTLEKKIFVRNCTTGIKDQIQQISELNIFPNPSNGEFTIKLNQAETKHIEVTIFDTHAKKVLKTQPEILKDYDKQFNLSQYKKGIYFIQVISGNEVYMQKLVIY